MCPCVANNRSLFQNPQGSRHKLVYDGMWHFDVPKCRDTDGGKVEVIARNACGEAYAATSLKVTPRQDDYRAVLRHNVKREWICPLQSFRYCSHRYRTVQYFMRT